MAPTLNFLTLLFILFLSLIKAIASEVVHYPPNSPPPNATKFVDSVGRRLFTGYTTSSFYTNSLASGSTSSCAISQTTCVLLSNMDAINEPKQIVMDSQSGTYYATNRNYLSVFVPSTGGGQAIQLAFSMVDVRLNPDIDKITVWGLSPAWQAANGLPRSGQFCETAGDDGASIVQLITPMDSQTNKDYGICLYCLNAPTCSRADCATSGTVYLSTYVGPQATPLSDDIGPHAIVAPFNWAVAACLQSDGSGTAAGFRAVADAVACNAGSSCADGSSYDSMALCPKGKYSSAGATACTQCAAGTYSSALGSSTCTQCPGGKYAGVGKSSCTSCTSGQLCPPESFSDYPCPLQFNCPTTNSVATVSV